MALYERYDGNGRKVERAFTVDGSEDDARHAALVDAGAGGWERGDSAPSTPKKRTPKEA